MPPVKFDALCRAWHQKTRRPVGAVLVDVGEDFFSRPDEKDPNGQKAMAAANPKFTRDDG